MKSINEYINEARLDVGSLKWDNAEWEVIEKMFNHINDNPKHFEWYEKMAKEKGNQYKYNMFDKKGLLYNHLDSWKILQKGGKFGYWTKDKCSDFSSSVLSSIYFALNAEIAFHNEDASKDEYTNADIETMKEMSSKIFDKLPKGKKLNTREEVLEIVEPIVAKYDGCKINPEQKDWASVWVSADDSGVWVKCHHEIDDAFADYINSVVGDGMFNSTYIDYGED